MNSPFPFGFPAPTAFYLTLFVMTLVIHVLFMNYVLAGSALLAWASWFGRPGGLIALTLRDWMPAAISAAITAGVAPLLFIQILYKHDFYTANLLLFHRWMLILPVLIVGFYLAYLLKAKRVDEWPAWARAVVGVGMLAGFLFVAYSWTENHLLSVQPAQVKTDFYASGSMLYRDAHLLPRLAMWCFGALPVMATIVGWQLWFAKRRGGAVEHAEFARLRALALSGVVLAGLCAVMYSRDVWAAVSAPMCWPYLLMALLGAVLVVAGWVIVRNTTLALAVASIGCVLMVLGATVAREAVRIGAIDLPALYAQHAAAARIGGLAVFLFFVVVNACLIAWCFALVRKGRITRS